MKFEIKQKVVMSDAKINNHSNSQTPPFMLTFKNHNHKVCNCLDDLGASLAMPFLVHCKIHTTPTKII
jgi:hypothetical protein